MHRIRPHWGYVTVLESAVDEEQRDSGLIVPLVADRGAHVTRGVVLHCSNRTEYGTPLIHDDLDAAVLAPGTVVYFTAFHRVLDVLIVRRQDVVAYMTDDEDDGLEPIG